MYICIFFFFFFSSRRRHTRYWRDWSSDVCSSDLSFIFILLAILSMFTTIRRLIESQTKEIAIIKALGYSNIQVSGHYISFGLLVGTLGALFGLLISPAMSWFVLETQKRMFSLPKWEIAYSLSSLVVALLVVMICVTSAYFASRKAIKGLPAVFLRGKNREVKHILLEKIKPLWRNISDEAKWAIRDAFTHRIRILMGIIGVAGSMMLLIAGIGMPISMNHLVDKAYNKDFSYAKRLTVSDYESANKAYKGQWVQINQAHFSKDDGYNRLLIIISKGSLVNATTEDGNKIKEGGLYVTNSFAKLADRKSTRLNSSHANISYAVFCLKKKKINISSIYIIYTLLPYHSPTLIIHPHKSRPHNLAITLVLITHNTEKFHYFVNNILSH